MNNLEAEIQFYELLSRGVRLLARHSTILFKILPYNEVWWWRHWKELHRWPPTSCGHDFCDLLGEDLVYHSPEGVVAACCLHFDGTEQRYRKLARILYWRYRYFKRRNARWLERQGVECV